MPGFGHVEIIPLRGLPMFKAGDDVSAEIEKALSDLGMALEDGDIVVIAQKIISKAEDRLIDLVDVTPSDRAKALGVETNKDPRLVELILRESDEVVAHKKDVLIVAHKLGFVMAHAGIDQSNVVGDGEHALLLPVDPDASARAVRQHLSQRYDADIAVIISDSFGRAWRWGTVGVAIGVAGLEPLVDLRGQPDLFGKRLAVTDVGVADEMAAAAGLVMGQAGEGVPVAILRGLDWRRGEQGIDTLLRKKNEDLFR